MNKKIRALKERKAKAIADARALTTLAETETREMTAEETTKFDALMAEAEKLNAAIDRETTLATEEARLGLAEIPNGYITVHDNREDDPKRGFRSFGEFAQATRKFPNFQGNGVALGGQLITAGAPTTYGNEAAGADGGFLIPPEFSREIFALSLAEDSLLPLTDNVNVQGNSMVFPKDETTPWGTDGVRAYWQNEAASGTQTKPKLGAAQLRLHKLMALVPLTDELMADTAALDGYLPNLMARSIRWKTNDAIINGTGAGQPLGVVNSGASVTVSKDGSQATGTLTITNLANMMAQLPPDSWGTAVWMVHNTVLGALFSLNSSGFPYYLPFGSGRGPLADSPFGSLLGRPVMVTQHANVFSSVGDVQLVDLKYYRTITKSGGIETATSMHLYFDADATAFRAIFRVDGQPKISAPITQAKGSAKLSPFLQLQAR